jgi:hypothetical protein
MVESELHRRIKYAIAKELVDMGYQAGVEVPREEGGFIDVQAKKGREVINIEIWKTHLPEWLVVKVGPDIGIKPQWMKELDKVVADTRLLMNQYPDRKDEIINSLIALQEEL